MYNEEPGEIKQPSILDNLQDSDAIAARTIKDFWNDANSRIDQERIWLRATYNINGRYDPAYASSDTTSQAFVQVTRPRVNTAVSMILPVLLPPGDECFTLTSSPSPSMPKLEAQLASDGVPPEKVKTVIKVAADFAASELQVKVLDGMEESDYKVKLQDVVNDAASLGTGIMCGPYVEKSFEVEPAKVELDPMGMSIEVAAKMKHQPGVEVINPWDFYPDKNAYCVEDMGYGTIRKSLNKYQLLKFAKKDGFNSEAIKKLVDRYGDAGNWNPQWWESQIANVNGSDTGNIDGRYEVLVRWGWLTGKEIADTGASIPEDRLDDMIMCQSWTCGNRCIYVGESELHKDRLPFYMVPYSKKARSPWGGGVPEMMFDSQDAVNACERSKMDNMALISGPQVMVFADRLMPGHNSLEIKPKKIWPVVSSEVQTSVKPIEFFSPQIALGEMQSVQRDHLQFIQEQTSIPNFLMGMGGAGTHNRTEGGAILQFNTASTPMKGVLFNFEKFLVSKIVKKFADFYEMYDPDPTIKGDARVITKGLSGLMERETLIADMLQVMQFASANPVWAEQVDLDRVFNIILMGKGLRDQRITLTPEEIQQKREAQQQMAQQGMEAKMQMEQASMKQQRAETAPKDALLQAMNQAPDNSNLKTVLIKKVLEVEGMIDPEIEAALEREMELQSLKDMDELHGMGTEAANRTMGGVDNVQSV